MLVPRFNPASAVAAVSVWVLHGEM